MFISTVKYEKYERKGDKIIKIGPCIFLFAIFDEIDDIGSNERNTSRLDNINNKTGDDDDHRCRLFFTDKLTKQFIYQIHVIPRNRTVYIIRLFFIRVEYFDLVDLVESWFM